MSKKMPWRWLAILVLPGLAMEVRADFRLPISGRVPKIVSVPADIEPEYLQQFSGISDLTIEIRDTRQNRLPAKLLQLLQGTFPGTNKLIWTEGEIEPARAAELSSLRPLEVWHRVQGQELSATEINRLYDLGPVPKVIFLPAAFSWRQLESARRVRYSSLAVEAEHLDAERIGWLCQERTVRKQVLLEQPTVEKILDLVGISPLRLVVATRQNRLEPRLLAVLAHLKGVAITVVVDGRLTLEDVEPLVVLNDFSLKVKLDTPPESIPGLGTTLAKIGPP